MARNRPAAILVPPSEGKAAGGNGPAWDDAPQTFAALAPQRRDVLAALAAAVAGGPGPATAKLLGVKGDALAQSCADDAVAATAPTLPAIARYTGVLYDHLAYAAQPAALRRRIDARLLVVSGLWGVVAPRDPIPPYRLKMGASLPGLGVLATWWRPTLTATLHDQLRGRFVWDLLPNEHARAWDPAAAVTRGRATVEFLTWQGSGAQRRLVKVSHWNKALKGVLAAWIAATDPAGLDDLAGFAPDDGTAAPYRYDPQRSRPDGDGGGHAVFVAADA